MGRNINPIIDGFKQQNPKAWEALYDECAGTLYQIIFRIVGDGVATEAIFELTFREISTRSYKQVRNDVDLRALTLRLGRKKALEYQRGEVCAETANQDLPGESHAVQAAIGRLKAEDRTLLQSIYVERLTLSQIALLSGLPRLEIKRRVAAVFKVLRAANDVAQKARTTELKDLTVPPVQSTSLDTRLNDYLSSAQRQSPAGRSFRAKA
jgi:DNA-directed RNA polymerase specialized sigma24 family protein